MRPNEIKKLIELVEQSNINELEVNRWGRKVRIRKNVGNPSSVTNPDNIQVPVMQQMQPIPTPAPQTPPNPQITATVEQSTPAITSAKLMEINSPMVGTFYRSPAPDADPYVQVGDVVKKGQVLCIIEAMKLMNEIESEESGKIVEILVDNAQPVEYNQVLFRIEKK